MNDQISKAHRFYEENYDIIFRCMWDRSQKISLGNKTVRCCRFCRKSHPEVTFRKRAHAVPEALGNRGLISFYERDACNSFFGRTIENDLGEWSGPMRTFMRIRGKNHLPKIRKKARSGEWSIEVDDQTLKVKCHEDSSISDVDTANNKMTFQVPRGPYRPVAVYKAFVKIALSLLPEAEMHAFQSTLNWIREEVHSKRKMNQVFVQTVENGPTQSYKLFAQILRRKSDCEDQPYAFLILAVGNYVFQIMIPSPEKEAGLSGSTLSFLPFPTSGGPDPEKYGRASPKVIDMSDPNPIKDIFEFALKFDTIEIEEPFEANAK